MVKFLEPDSISNIALTEDDCLATLTNYAQWSPDATSFVRLEHPTNGKVVFTLRDYTRTGFVSLIGLFDPSFTHNEDCYQRAHVLYACHNITQIIVDGLFVGPEARPISKGQQVIVEFNGQHVTISVPSLRGGSYSHEITWPKGFVFGLYMTIIGESWHVTEV
ncbi:hypothetical protein RCL1_006547 [Eukaryota sp. TZLM3-RCL]